MGVWGTAIKSNDTFADVYSDFFELYNDGVEVKEISDKLIADNWEMFENPFDSNNFWFALAMAQWQCAQLDPDILHKVKTIIDSDADLKVWQDMNASEKDIIKRKGVLNKFIAKISTPKEKVRKPKKKKIVQPLFEKGDCITFNLAEEIYGGAVILEALKDTPYGYMLAALTRISQPKIPSIKDFENAEVLIRNYANWNDTPVITWLSTGLNENSDLYRKVCSIPISRIYDINSGEFGFAAGLNRNLQEVVFQQFESEKSKLKPSAKISIHRLIDKPKWKFWL